MTPDGLDLPADEPLAPFLGAPGRRPLAARARVASRDAPAAAHSARVRGRCGGARPAEARDRASRAARSGSSRRRSTRAPTSSPRCSRCSPSASRCGRPTPATSTATGRRSTSPRWPRRRSSSSLSLFIAGLAVARLAGLLESDVDAAWWTFLVLVVVIAIDASRTAVSLRTARRFGSAALQANALHFGGDLLGSAAVLAGLAAAAAGYPNGDSLAALFVACLVLVAAVRLIRRNVDVLMDRAPAEAAEAAREAIARIEPPVDVRRLRMRYAAGRHFADVVVAVAPGAAVGQGHAVADAVEEAVQRALPGERRRRPRRAGGGRGRHPRPRARRRADRRAACARCTTSPSSRSATARPSRSTSSSRASCRWSRPTPSPRRSSGRSSPRCPRSSRCRRTSSRSPRRASAGRRTDDPSAPRSSAVVRGDDGRGAALAALPAHRRGPRGAT